MVTKHAATAILCKRIWDALFPNELRNDRFI
jgi:hypothetical protein